MKIDLGFIILCPNKNIGAIRNTCGSIKHHAWDRDCLAVVGNDATNEEIDEMTKYCPIYKGKDTITSLINKGFRHFKHEWGLLLFAGARIPPFLEKKITPFIQNENDIIYPMVVNPEKKYDFVGSSLNGVVINKKFFNKVGKFPETEMYKIGQNDFEMVKTFWSFQALEQNAIFKGVLGVRII